MHHLKMDSYHAIASLWDILGGRAAAEAILNGEKFGRFFCLCILLGRRNAVYLTLYYGRLGWMVGVGRNIILKVDDNPVLGSRAGGL